MKDQSISIEQMQEIANSLRVKGYAVSYVPDIDQMIVTIRETNDIVLNLKSKSQLITQISLIKDKNVFALEIYLEPDSEDVKIFAALEVNDNIVGYLEKVAKENNSIQLNVIGEDLNLISSRHFFESDLSKAVLQRELDKLKLQNVE